MWPWEVGCVLGEISKGLAGSSVGSDFCAGRLLGPVCTAESIAIE